MNPYRYTAGQSSAIRKSRVEGKPSMLPKPRRPSSTDRLSTELRRPSTAGRRSNSADPPRSTFGVGRLSREASATKFYSNPRSKSQQGETRYGQPATTPLRSSHYSWTSVTPGYSTPSASGKQNWQTALDRVLAFITVKDQRAIINAAWQRAEWHRVSEALSARAGSSSCGSFIKPLTIARFVEITGWLVQSITKEPIKLNTDNYLIKLPHLSKRFLYPGTLSKSWLKTVNTLHAFPHALAFIAYLLDLLSHIEMPVTDEWLYQQKKDDLDCLRRDHLHNCWLRFQDPDPQFDDLNKEYFQNLKMLLGDHDEKIAELQEVIREHEATLALCEEAETGTRAEEARLRGRWQKLEEALHKEQLKRSAIRVLASSLRVHSQETMAMLQELEQVVERVLATVRQLDEEVAHQPLSVADKKRLLEERDYVLRVCDSKQAMAKQIIKMILEKETQLEQWQAKTLDSCIKYQQGLIHLSDNFQLSTYVINENELMDGTSSETVSRGLLALRENASALNKLFSSREQEKASRRRQTARLWEESNARVRELKALEEAERQTIEAEAAEDKAHVEAWSMQLRQNHQRMEALALKQETKDKVEAELLFWQKQNDAWQEKLPTMKDYIKNLKVEAEQLLQVGKSKRHDVAKRCMKLAHEKLGH